MKTSYLNRFPKKFRNSVMDFYKDEDGWWIRLDCGGDYIFCDYYSDYVIHEDTQKEALETFRAYIEHK